MMSIASFYVYLFSFPPLKKSPQIMAGQTRRFLFLLWLLADVSEDTTVNVENVTVYSIRSL